MEELRDHRCHPLKMTGSIFSLHAFGNALYGYPRGDPFRINLIDLRNKNGTHTLHFEKLTVSILIPRIPFKILTLIELSGINKNGHHDMVARLPNLANE
jgi:hypothetical protein